MTFSLLVFSLDRELFTGDAKSVRVPGAAGELEVLAHHTPLISQLKEGDIIIETADGTQKKLPVAGGVLDVKEHEVVILANL